MVPANVSRRRPPAARPNARPPSSPGDEVVLIRPLERTLRRGHHEREERECHRAEHRDAVVDVVSSSEYGSRPVIRFRSAPRRHGGHTETRSSYSG